MVILSTSQDQVSNFIVNNVYRGQTQSLRPKFRIKSQYYENKI